MPAAKVRVNYEELGAIEHQFHDQADTVHNLVCTLQNLIDSLRANWTGDNADTFFKDMNEHVLPPLERLAKALKQAGVAAREVSVIFQEGEEEAAAFFKGGDSVGGSGADRAVPLSAQDTNRYNALVAAYNQELQFHKELEAQINLLSANGWINLVAGTRDDYQRMLTESDARLRMMEAQFTELKSKTADVFVDRSRYSDADLIPQEGGTCVAYGAMNNLVMRGVKISPDDARTLYRAFEEEGGRGRGTFLGIHLDSGGFNRDVGMDIIEKYGFKPEISVAQGAWIPLSEGHQLHNVSYYDPSKGSVESQAVQSLVQELRTGNPVYVTTTAGFVGMPNSGHAMNVVGTNFDANGKLESVVVYTNWGNSVTDGGYKTIPAATFLNDWKARGYYMMKLHQ